MELFTQEGASVKESIGIIDPEELTAHASGGLLALSMESGPEVLRQMLEAEADALAGPKGKHQVSRKTHRHSKEKSRLVMGGEKVPVERPRMRLITSSA